MKIISDKHTRHRFSGWWRKLGSMIYSGKFASIFLSSDRIIPSTLQSSTCATKHEPVVILGDPVETLKADLPAARSTNLSWKSNSDPLVRKSFVPNNVRESWTHKHCYQIFNSDIGLRAKKREIFLTPWVVNAVDQKPWD